MLDVDPMFIVTPFNKLPIGKKLPTKADVERIRAFGRLFLTGSVEAAGRSKSKDAAVGRSLKENGIVIRELRTPLGLVRMRRGTGPHDGWNAQVFAPASEV